MISSAKIIGLCGPSGSGKTLLCQKLVKELHEAGVQCSGFISPPVFEGTTKSAITVQWLETNQKRVLMTTVNEFSKNFIGRWQINPDTFDWINEELADLGPCRIFFCDEIGPLEVEQGKGWVKALEFLDEAQFEVGIVTLRPALEPYFRQRYPDMQLHYLDNEENAETVISKVKKLIGID